MWECEGWHQPAPSLLWAKEWCQCYYLILHNITHMYLIYIPVLKYKLIRKCLIIWISAFIYTFSVTFSCLNFFGAVVWKGIHFLCGHFNSFLLTAWGSSVYVWRQCRNCWKCNIINNLNNYKSTLTSITESQLAIKRGCQYNLLIKL